VRDLVVEGARSLAQHRVRTVLSGLGILFGVAAVIGILSIGEGARREQELLIEQLGVLNFQIRQREQPEDDEAVEEMRRITRGLSQRDVHALREILPEAVHVGGMREIDVRDLVPKPEDRSALRVLGIDTDHLAGSPLTLIEGRPLRQADAAAGARVALLGTAARKQLFGTEPAVGEQIRLGSVWVRVVGVFDAGTTGGASMEGVDVEDRSGDILIPLSTSLQHFAVSDEEPELDEIQVTVSRIEAVPGHTAVAARALTRLHKDQPVFDLVVPLTLLEQSKAQQRIFNVVMGLIAGISLLVGGIGIMNIMLASVMERTREIGVRMAVGASPRDIHRLFLVEASLISLVGGLLGIVAGQGIAWAVASFTGWATAVSPEAVVLATVISMVEGVVFGYLPARRAAQLQPALAVRAA
jgi:putative ABC transport system permease protein